MAVIIRDENVGKSCLIHPRVLDQIGWLRDLISREVIFKDKIIGSTCIIKTMTGTREKYGVEFGHTIWANEIDYSYSGVANLHGRGKTGHCMYFPIKDCIIQPKINWKDSDIGLEYIQSLRRHARESDLRFYPDNLDLLSESTSNLHKEKASKIHGMVDKLPLGGFKKDEPMTPFMPFLNKPGKSGVLNELLIRCEPIKTNKDGEVIKLQCINESVIIGQRFIGEEVSDGRCSGSIKCRRKVNRTCTY